jgi:hypothetical protein
VYVRGEPYFGKFQDKAETSSDEFESTEDIRRDSHPMEERFGRGSRLLVQFPLVCGSVKFGALQMKIF